MTIYFSLRKAALKYNIKTVKTIILGNIITRALKRLIASKIKVCVYIIYVGALCIIILYI